MIKKIDLVIVGLGYIGLPTAAIIADKGLRVHGVDTNSTLVKNLKNHNFKFSEPGLKQMVEKVIRNGQLTVSTKAQMSSNYLIVVPTPFRENREPNLDYVFSAVDGLINILSKNDLIIIESTCPVGTTEKVFEYINNLRPDLNKEFNIAYCPERVIPGNTLYELIHNDRVIGGINESSTKLALNFYKKYVKGSLHGTNSKIAEMCKLVENSSRDNQIAFANEISIICDQIGIDSDEVINLANKHPRVNILSPGCGVGGHCIAVDPYFLISSFPNSTKLIEQSRKVNDFKSDWCLEKILIEAEIFEKKNRVKPNIFLMGLTYKANIDDTRESPALKIALKLYNSKYRDYVSCVDPNIFEMKQLKLSDLEDANENGDIIVYLVGHKEFYESYFSDKKIILDFCGINK